MRILDELYDVCASHLSSVEGGLEGEKACSKACIVASKSVCPPIVVASLWFRSFSYSWDNVPLAQCSCDDSMTLIYSLIDLNNLRLNECPRRYRSLERGSCPENSTVQWESLRGKNNVSL
ncbi:hypothetical protein PM082_018936 [Marasmius tenuissimus]|nr:hypothetical protein PM082_018936 [Marasmius tenuissimus]